MYNDGFEDFTIICGEHQFRVHHYVLCMHSPVLEKMCRGPFKVFQASSATL